MMNARLGRLGFLAILLTGCALAMPAMASEIQPHRAVYDLSLGSAKTSSGVVSASGIMTYEWGETCSGWTVEQRFRLRLEYSDQDGSEIASNLVTWESKDGRSYRFNERRLRNGEMDQEIRGEAHLDQPKTYLVAFDAGGVKLSAAAHAIVGQAVDATRKDPNSHITILGRRSAAGAKSEDEHLPKLRAEAVRAELIRAGIPAATIKISVEAGTSLALPTAQGTAKPQDHRVEILLEPGHRGGSAEFAKPEQATIPLAPDVLFPTAHTLLLIDRAQVGDQFIARHVFDGTSVDDATLVSAVVGPTLKPGAQQGEDKPIKSPLLEHPSWRMRLAFFPTESKSEQPDYELSMQLLDNGVSQGMSLDYGDYAIRARLLQIEALPKPSC